MQNKCFFLCSEHSIEHWINEVHIRRDGKQY